MIGSRRSALSLAEFAKAHVSERTSPATSPLSSSSASHSPQRDWVLSGGITTWSPEVGLIPIVSLLNHPAVTLSHKRRQESVFFFHAQIINRGRELPKPRINLFTWLVDRNPRPRIFRPTSRPQRIVLNRRQYRHSDRIEPTISKGARKPFARHVKPNTRRQRPIRNTNRAALNRNI